MAKLSGKDIILVIGGTTVTANDVISVSTNVTHEKAESTGAGDDWTTFVSDIIKGGTLTINGYRQGGGSAPAASLRKVLMDAYALDSHSATIVIRPSGVASGRRSISGTMIIDSLPANWSRNETATLTCDATFNGAVVID